MLRSRELYSFDMHRMALAVMFLAATASQAQFAGKITVTRILLDARVTDFRGDPIRDLRPEDFAVRIGGESAVVESAEWVDDVTPRPAVAGESHSPGQEPRSSPPPGRLFVIFVQTDHGREDFRLRGQISFILQAEKLIESMQPEDRLAVFQHDSRLKFRLDFTSDKEAVMAALRDTLYLDLPPPPLPGEPALHPHLDRDEMLRAWNVEDALAVVGRALTHVSGPKSMLLLGWGLGRLSSNGGVNMRWKDYDDAVNALREARTSVFSLDVAAADYHDLALGLAQLAAETGGTYASTFRFPQAVIQRLSRTVSGHYELVLVRPEALPIGSHSIDLRVKRSGVQILAHRKYADK